MAHPLGELVLLLPAGRHCALPEHLATLESELATHAVAARRVYLGDEPRAVVEREMAAGVRFFALCGDLVATTSVLPAFVDTQTGTVGDAALALFPGGRVNDLAMTFGLDLNPRAAALLLASDRILRADVGVATVTTSAGEVEVLVANDLVVGLAAVVLGRRRRLRGLRRVGDLLAWWSALITHAPRAYDVDMVFAEWHERATQIRLANGMFAHERLQISPRALPDDGAWDVQAWSGPRTLPFTAMAKMLHTEHLPSPHISQWRHSSVSVDAARPTPVAVDEQVVGTTPVRVRMLPGALRLKV